MGWLSLIQARRFWVHALFAVAILGAVNVAVLRAVGTQLSLAMSIILEFGIVGLIFAIPVVLTLVALRRPLLRLIAIASDCPPPAVRVVIGIVSEKLRVIEDDIEQLKRTGADFEYSSASQWVRRVIFAVAEGPYFATDVQVPSEFLAKYRPYLEAQAEYLDRTGHTGSVRVNVASKAELEADRLAHPEAWAEYVEWHRKHPTLLHCEPGTARDLARANGMGDVLDTAFWSNELALLLEYPPGKARLRVALVGEVGYQHCASFIEDVLKNSVPFSDLE